MERDLRIGMEAVREADDLAVLDFGDAYESRRRAFIEDVMRDDPRENRARAERDASAQVDRLIEAARRRLSRQ